MTDDVAAQSAERPDRHRSGWNYETGGEGVTPKGRELYFYTMRAWPFGKIPQNSRAAAIEQIEKMSRFGDSRRTAADDSWRQIGPTEVGGRVRSIALHPTDGQTLWIGAADGGVWKSTDRGATWTAQMQDANAIAMGAVAVDPQNPQVLYAGTGEMSSNVDAYTGAGIFTSRDGGDTWEVLGLTRVGAFSRIVVDPQNSQNIYAGATKNNGGFYLSRDGGTTWRRTNDNPVSDVAINPQNPQEIWISLMGNGVRFSDDAGETWTSRSGGFGGTGITIARSSLAVYPADPSILYALVYEYVGSDQRSSFSRIYKSTNKGRSWQRVYNNSGGNNFLSNPGSPSQGWYNNVIAVKPDDPDVVLAGGVRMVRTTDGGSSWSQIANEVHVDHHAMAFDPTEPSRFYSGNDGGMYRSENSGNSWQNINNNLPITQFYALAIDQRQTDLTYGGTQDNGTLRTTSTRFGDVFGGDGFEVAVDPEEETIIYIERENGQMYRIQGNTAINMFQSSELNMDPDSANWSSPLRLDPNDPQRLYSGRHRLWVTLNPRGARGQFGWLPVSPGVAGNISAMAVSPYSSSTIFIGSAQGVVMRTTDEELIEWDDLSFGKGLPNRAVTDFEFSLTDPNTLYVTFSGFFTDHVYKSTDLGESWVSISDGLPDIPTNTIAIHPDDEQTLFVGTDLGAFITQDGGESWSVYNEGLPRVAIVDLKVHLESRTLRAATHGRSMFERGIGGEPIEVNPSITSPHGGEVWTGGTANRISWGGFDDETGVRIEFSLDDGENWRELAASVIGANFRWNTVNASTTRARIRITAMSHPDRTVTSNSFTIVPFEEGTLLTTDSKPTVAYGIAYDGEHLWTTDFGGNSLLKLDPETFDAVDEIELDAEAGDSLFTGITYYPGRQTLFVHRLNSTTQSGAGGVIAEVNRDGTVRGVWPSPAAYPIGLAWLGERNPNNPELGLLAASDRDNQQFYYLYFPDDFDPGASSVVPISQVQRDVIVESGPRGMTADEGSIWQVITDFSGGSLQGATANRFDIDRISEQDPMCTIDLNSPGGTINARGIELDVRDRSLWITDFGGNLYKIASCYTAPGPSDSGYISSVSIDRSRNLGLSARVEPNPFAETTTLTLTVERAADLRIRLLDNAGRTLRDYPSQRYTPGTHAIPIDATGLASGRYYWSIEDGDGRRMGGSLVVVR